MQVEKTYNTKIIEQNECKTVAQNFQIEMENITTLLEDNKKAVQELQDKSGKLHIEQHQLKNQIEETKLKTKSIQDESTATNEKKVCIITAS